MTNDPLFARIGADWRRQTVDLDRIRRLTERRRQRMLLALIAKAAGVGIALLASAWFIWLALRGAPSIFGLAGIILLIALPLMLLELAGTRRVLDLGRDDTPVGILHRMRNQATMARQLLWCNRLAALLLTLSAVALLGLYGAGRARMEETLIFAPIWLLFALAGWAWQMRQARRLDDEIARCDAFLAEFDQADSA